MLGIDLGRLRQRLGILQRRLDGLEKGAPACISNTVPHATESSWASQKPDSPHDVDAATAQRLHDAEIVLATQRRLLKGKHCDLAELEALAELLIADVDRRGGFIFSSRPTDDETLNLALFSLELGRLTAFLVGGDEKLAPTGVGLVVGALLADAPLLEAVEIEEAVKREQFAEHGRDAAELLRNLKSIDEKVVKAVYYHHARLDGSGVPKARSEKFTPECRLLSVAAAYMEQRWPRPNEAPADPRRALREVLLEAESGKLDLAVAFRLLDVSFYPIGTAVELSGGEWAEVVATQRLGADLELASLPIVRLVRDAVGRAMSSPIFWNLAQRKNSRIVRVLGDDDHKRAA